MQLRILHFFHCIGEKKWSPLDAAGGIQQGAAAWKANSAQTRNSSASSSTVPSSTPGIGTCKSSCR